jgi:superfamily II DNA/RNA helicase
VNIDTSPLPDPANAPAAAPDASVADATAPPATFASLGLTPTLVRATVANGYTTPTPIQVAAIPPVIAGRDLLGAAQTGSGKTAAYALPLLHRLEAATRHRPRRTAALVLVPTRELAIQVGETLHELASHGTPDLKIAVVFGGVSVNPQMMALRGGAEIVVATPGRLLDLVDKHALGLIDLEMLVLDEADRLLDAGFADEVNQVLSLLPRRRQSLLFSATFPPAVHKLAARLLQDPVLVEVAVEPETAPDITQRAIEVDTPRRTALLRHLIQAEGWSRVLVFVATRYASDHVADKLRRNGVTAVSFHGERSQGARRQALGDFKAGEATVVVATDVAARGLDISRLPVVVNYDLPRSPTDHTHRIGRTARAGASGLAVSFVAPEDEAHFRVIEKRQGRRVPRERIAGFEPTTTAPPPALGDEDGTGGIKGKRPSKKDKLRALAAKGG